MTQRQLKRLKDGFDYVGNGANHGAIDSDVQLHFPEGTIGPEGKHYLGLELPKLNRNFLERLGERHGHNGNIKRTENINVVLADGRNMIMVVTTNSNMPRMHIRRAAMEIIGVKAAEIIGVVQDEEILAMLSDDSTLVAECDGSLSLVVKDETPDEELRRLTDDPPSEYDVTRPDQAVGGIAQLAWCADIGGGIPL